MASDSVPGGQQAASPGPITAAKYPTPQGPSLFDRLFAKGHDGTAEYDIPYPFAALRRALAKRLGDGSGPEFHEVLIPIGRALQRNAAAPDFFNSPRFVVTMARESSAPTMPFRPLLKDRLFIGYQEKAESLEIISYAAQAGRFSFQIVRDYAAGKTPRVAPANRVLCVSCHQNGGPIFAEPPWRETNANPKVAQRLMKSGHAFSGVTVRTGSRAREAAFQISSSVQRANLLSVYQRLWRDACTVPQQPTRAVECRSAILILALQYALSNRRHFDRTSIAYRETVLGTFADGWAGHWPAGLTIPNPLIPDVDPMTSARPSALADPLTPRPPQEVWRASNRDDLERAVEGVAQFFSHKDAETLDIHLATLMRDKPAPTSLLKTPCAFSTRPFPDGRTRVTFRCRRSEESRFLLDGEIFLLGDTPEKGRIHTLHFAEGDRFDALRITAAPSEQVDRRFGLRLRLLEFEGRLRPRRANGNALAGLQLRWSRLWKENYGPSEELPHYPINGEAIISTIEDFSLVRTTVERMAAGARSGHNDAFSDKPFRRTAVLEALFAQLTLPHKRHPAGRAPADHARARRDRAGKPNTIAHPPHAKDGVLALFHRHCGSCHSGPDRFPPNFLFGNAVRQKTSIAHCGERIAHRLHMWNVAAADRSKSPMPPIGHLLASGWAIDSWRGSNALAALRRHAQALGEGPPARSERTVPDGRTIYDDFPACLLPVDQR